MYTFAYYPILFLLIPVFVWIYFNFKKGATAIRFPFSYQFKRVNFFSPSSIISRVPLILKSMVLILLVLAAARPQRYSVSREISSSGVDIILCLDTSGSMRALDFEFDGKRVNRLSAVKGVVQDFIKKRPHDRIGLVVFGEEAFTQSPLTLDKGLLLSLVKGLEVGMAGDSTALGDAIAIGGKRLKDLKAKSKILILLTDGRNNSGNISPESASEALRAFGIKIYTIGVGSFGLVPFDVKTFFGNQIIKQKVDLDEETLQKVADIGGGKYFLASNSRELAKIYDIIDKAEKREVKLKEFFHFEELYRYFLIPAIILVLLELILKSFFLRVMP